MTDLIPPLPPGAEKKQGLLKRIFSKKQTTTHQNDLPPAPGPINSKPNELLQSPHFEKDGELNTIRQSLGLEQTQKHEEVPQELTKLQSPKSGLDSITLDIPPEKINTVDKNKEENIKDLLDDIKPNYQPTKTLPPIPKLTAQAKDYNSLDFTKEIPLQKEKKKDSDFSWDDADLFTTQANKPITSRQIDSLDKMRSTSNSFDWTSDVKHQPKQKEETSTLTDNKSNKQELLKELEKEVLENKIEEEKPITNSKELPELKPVDDKVQSPKIEETKEDNNFLSQPVQKFADQVRERIADQVRKEEKQKLLQQIKEEQEKEMQRKEAESKKLLEDEKQKIINKLKDEQQKELQQKEAESKKLLEDEKQKIINKLKDEQEKEIQRKILESKKELDGEKDKVLKEAKDELAKAKNERLATQKELESKKQQLELEKVEFEKKKLMLEQKEKSLSEKEMTLNKTKEDIKLQKVQLENDKKEAQELLDKLAKMREEFKDLHAKIDLINQRIKLNEELEKNLEKREAAIEVAQAKFQDLEKNIREDGFSKYLDTELNAKQITYPEIKGKISDEYQGEDHSEIYQLIDKCRSMVWQNNIKEARNTYMLARDKYHELLEKGKDDEKLYMAIRELYDDINLAVMK